MNCSVCGYALKPLFTSVYCTNSRCEPSIYKFILTLKAGGGRYFYLIEDFESCDIAIAGTVLSGELFKVRNFDEKEFDSIKTELGAYGVTTVFWAPKADEVSFIEMVKRSAVGYWNVRDGKIV